MRRFLGVLCLSAFAQTSQLTPDQERLNIESFEKVWTTVRDKHWQKNPGGLDWQAVHDELRPKIEKAQTMDQARAVMSEMLARLKETHFAIVPGDLYAAYDTDGGGEGSAGIELRILDRQAVVTDVDAGSPAAAAGVHAGWIVESSRGQQLAPVIAKLGGDLSELMMTRAVLNRVTGPVGSSVRIVFVDGAGKKRQLDLKLVEPRGNLSRFGNLPPMHVWYESKRIGSAGYVRFNMFLDLPRVMASFADSVKSCADCTGFVVDLRGNPGGIGGMAMGMAGFFVDKPDLQLGKMYMRDATLKFVINPRPPVFNGPLAVLVDGDSASTSEILSEGLKDLGRARVFGTKTAAAALPSIFELLPNGDGFQYAIANYISEGGKPLEGLGVTPDVEVKLTRDALLAGHDPVVDAALEWIRSKNK